mmetsp:Transcript_22758/g.28055  ORF Transcript_22758/g.28055 Transcript_22758/m.28055 type:complete len:93 (-) Transcript_22758:347-625(-)
MEGRCDKCGECTSSALNPVAKCKDSCYTSRHSWGKKCRAGSCAGCMECADKDEPPSCAPFCEAHEAGMDAMCNWHVCTGCDACAKDEDVGAM